MAFPGDYDKYQEITIDHTKVSADLTDFVLYIDLSDLSKAGADIFDTCRTDGGDIRVTKSDGTTELAREVVAIDTTGKTGELHVKFSGTLSSSVDTVIRIYYNGIDTEPATSATYGRDAVWSDYYAVWHFQGTAGTGAKVTDSTGNGRTLTENGGPASAAGKMGGGANSGYSMDGSASAVGSTTGMDWLEMSTSVPSAIGSSPFTMSVWFKPDFTPSTTWRLINMEQNGPNGRPYSWTTINGSFNFGAGVEKSTGSSNDVSISAPFSSGNWGYSAFGLNASSYPFGFANGTLTTSATLESGSYSTFTSPFYINRRYNTSYSNAQVYGDGAYDEVRIRFSELNENWLDTEYTNQNNASAFYATSDEQGGVIEQALTAAVGATASVNSAVTFALSLAAAAAAASTIGNVKSFFRTLTASTTGSATIATVNVIKQALTAAVDATVTITRQQLQGAILTSQATLQATIDTVATFKRTLTGNVDATVSVSRLKTLYRTLTTSVSAASSVVAVKTFFQTLTANVTAAGNVTRGSLTRLLSMVASVTGAAKLNELFYKKKYTKEDEDYKRKY